jgi:hypothetical protein
MPIGKEPKSGVAEEEEEEAGRVICELFGGIIGAEVPLGGTKAKGEEEDEEEEEGGSLIFSSHQTFPFSR